MNKNEGKAENLPSVFQMDLTKREEFLSQVGSFTQEQRNIFHRICDFYDPALDYNRFVLHAGKDILFANNQIEVLMGKLKNAHYGLLQFKVIDGELKPSRIVLSNRDSEDYYAALIDDEYQRTLLEESRPFLSTTEMEDMHQRIPFDLLENLTADTLSPGLIKSTEPKQKIYTITLNTGNPIVCTKSSLKTLLHLCHEKIKHNLSSSSFLAAISRHMDSKISNIQKNLGSKDRDFWILLTGKMIQSREDLQVRIKNIDTALFQACEVLKNYYTNAIKEEDQEKQDNAEKEAAINEVCMDILQKENFLVTEEELLNMLNTHEKRWPGFKDQFYEKAVKVNHKIGLPLVLSLNGNYIHRDHVYPYFRAELNTQSKELKYHYVQLMERMLRTSNKDKTTVFYTRDTFRDDIMDNIQNDSPVLAEFLKKPRIISEGIVHYFKNLKKVRDVNKIKDFMNNFFEHGIIKFKDIDFLLDLYLLEIFEEAYKFLSWWRKFLLRVSGKKDSFSNQFSGMIEKSSTTAVYSGPSIDKRRSQEMRRAEADRSGQTSRRRKDDSSQTAYRRKSRQEQQGPQYNLKQRNKAWMEFEDAFNRKK